MVEKIVVSLDDSIKETEEQFDNLTVVEALKSIPDMSEVNATMSSALKNIPNILAANNALLNSSMNQMKILSQSNFSKIEEVFSVMDFTTINSGLTAIESVRMDNLFKSIVTSENLVKLREYLKQDFQEVVEYKTAESDIFVEITVVQGAKVEQPQDSIKTKIITFFMGLLADEIASVGADLIKLLAEIVMTVLILVASGNSAEVIKKIESKVSENSTVQEIQRIYEEANPEFLLYDVGIIRTESFIRAGKSRQAHPVQTEKFKTNTVVEVIERNNNWIKVQITNDNTCISGWIEESKIIKLKTVK